MKLSFKKPFLAFNKILPHPQDHFIYFAKQVPFSYPLGEFEADIQTSLARYQSYEQTGYIFKYDKGCMIEPSMGWAITRKQELIYESLPYSRDTQLAFPSYLRTNLFRFNLNNLHLKEGIPIRYGLTNYFHFFNDFVGQVYLLNEQGIPKHIPLIIPEWAMSIKYVDYFMKTLDFLKDRPLILQKPHQLIYLKSAIFCKNIPSIKDHFEFIRTHFRGPASTRGLPKKIFLTRVNTRERELKNKEEVYNLVSGLGFTVIDANLLPVEKQVALFSEATHVIGIHGAGLANSIFHKNKNLKLLELFPRNAIPPHYFWLAKELGFTYYAMCHAEEKNGSFEIDTQKLANFIQEKAFPD